jgi:hypothetical protein
VASDDPAKVASFNRMERQNHHGRSSRPSALRPRDCSPTRARHSCLPMC